MRADVTIDRKTFHELKELMGADFVSEIVDTYEEETGALIGQLQLYLAAQDAPAFARCAHSIKSSSASLGALLFSQQARELELLGKAGDLSAARPGLERLEADFPAVMRRLEELKNEP